MVITHDRDIAARMARRIEMLDGQIVSDSADKAAPSPSRLLAIPPDDEDIRP